MSPIFEDDGSRPFPAKSTALPVHGRSQQCLDVRLIGHTARVRLDSQPAKHRRRYPDGDRLRCRLQVGELREASAAQAASRNFGLRGSAALPGYVQASAAGREPLLKEVWGNVWRELIWPCRRAWVGLAALWLVLLGIGVVCALVSEWFWRVSVRRYTSAST